VAEVSVAYYFERSQTLASLLADQAKLRPDHVAFVISKPDGTCRHVSYAEIFERARAAANLLASYGLVRGDRVHVHLGNRLEFLDVWFGCALRGLVMVPTGLNSTASEVAFVRAHSESRLSIVDTQRLDVIDSDDKPALDTVVIEVTSDDWLSGQSSIDATFDLTSETPLSVMYTSGTTSRPKGVVVTHANYLHVGEMLGQHLRIRPCDRWLVVLPLFHANAQYYSVMSELTSGASVALMPSFSASKWGQQVQEHQATLGSLFASPIRMILAKLPPPGYDWDGLRVTMFAQNLDGEEVQHFERTFQTKLLQLYGMTETIAPPLANSPLCLSRSDSIGRPTLNTELAVRRADGSDAETGEAGELFVRGEPGRTLMAGYLNDPDATAQTLTDGWLRTGDFVRVDADGFFYFVDRVKDMVKRGGENVALSEVERVINSHPAVVESAVIGVPERMRDVSIHAFVVNESHTSAADIQEWCRQRLAKFKVPDAVTFVDALPRTSVGKIEKRSLAAPRTGTEADGGRSPTA
jgi:Acyl-CoA synthetases (AMP-forming)/AMP-acid ligases II